MDASIASVTTPAAHQRRPAAFAQRVEPPSAPVQATPQPPATSFGGGASESAQPAQRSVDRDDATGSLVYRLIDVSTGYVTVQTPTDARLKLRAYIDGVLKPNAEPAIEVMV